MNCSLCNSNIPKAYLWYIKPSKIQKMNEILKKSYKKNVEAIKNSMSMPETLTDLVNGAMNQKK